MRPVLPVLMLMTNFVTIAAAVEPQTEFVPAQSETDTVGRGANVVLDILAKRLSLTDDQKTKILPILEERRQKIQEVRADSALRRRQTMRQVRGIYEDSDTRINAVLSAEQQKAYAAFEQEMRTQLKGRRSQASSTSD